MRTVADGAWGGCKRYYQIAEPGFLEAVEEILRLPSSRSSDEQLFRDLMDRFTVLAEACSRFSQEVYRRTGTSVETDTKEMIERNLGIARSVFGKQSLETLATIYLYNSVGFDELRSALGPISFTFLRGKLRQLEKEGFVQRDDSSRGQNARFSLTYKGKMIARLGEPVFLYLRLVGGWRDAAPESTPPVKTGADPAPGGARQT